MKTHPIRFTTIAAAVWAVIICIAATAAVSPAAAQEQPFLFGVAGWSAEIDPDAVTPGSFFDIFTYAGPETPSLILGADDWAQIGMMLTDARYGETGANVRVTVDTDGDGRLEPMDYADPIHPWIRPDNGTPNDYSDDPVAWQWRYPDTYPDPQLRGTFMSLTWNPETFTIDGFPWDAFEWLWYIGRFDTTFETTLFQGQLYTNSWFARDDYWQVRPNGSYLVMAEVDDNGDMIYALNEPREQLVLRIQSAGFTGRVLDADQNPVSGATITAESLFAYGEASSREDGGFGVYGLLPDDSYTVSIDAPGKVVRVIQTALGIDEYERDLGAIVLQDAMSIVGVLMLDRDGDGVPGEPEDRFVPYVDQYGWEQNTLPVFIEARNLSGRGRGVGSVVFQVGDVSADFIIDIPITEAATFELAFEAEGYAADTVTVQVGAGGGDAGEVALVKAAKLTGTVRLPAPVVDWNSIDVQAIRTDDPDLRYYGYGYFDPYYIPGSCSDPAHETYSTCTEAGGAWTDAVWLDEPRPVETGTFRIDGVPAGTYRLEIRVLGYRTRILPEVVVEAGADRDVGEVPLSQGSVISGRVRIKGDTTNFKADEFDTAKGDLSVWLTAWSPNLNWSGTEVRIPRGVDQSAPYTITGLENGMHEIYGDLGEGYEMVDENGETPVVIDLQERFTQNLLFKPFEGRIEGEITATDAALDLSKVAVEVKRPWDWLPPKMATVANGGIDPETGRYRVDGLGTGDFVVVAGMYGNLDTHDGSAPLRALSTVGVTIHRVFVNNDPASPTRRDIGFGKGYYISGTIRLDPDDPPWHDFGDGGGGEANGVRDAVAGPYDERISIAADLAGQVVIAEPLDLRLMGDTEGTNPPTVGVIVESGDGEATFRIDGLSPGAYNIRTPFNSPRILSLSGSGDIWEDALYYSGGENTHHWTTDSARVVIQEENVSGLTFDLANGHTVSGRVVLPEALTLTDELWDQWTWVAHIELETARNMLLGHGGPLFKRDFEEGTTHSFSFQHVADGNYVIYFWTDLYVPRSIRVPVNGADVSQTLFITPGVDLVGRLIDAETGEPVTAADGVTVACESSPPVEGTYRETRSDEWSRSYIEDESGIRTGDLGGTEGKRENSVPGRFHLTAVPAGHDYIVGVFTLKGLKTQGAKNYVDKLVAGIKVPEGATGEIEVGNILMQEGTTITGRLTDPDGNPVPGVDVVALPSDSHAGRLELAGTSGAQGFYTIYGVDPEIGYYDLIAARRPWIFSDWGREVTWGEKRRYNVRPDTLSADTGRTADADFVLRRATASLSGTVTIPENAEFMLPFVSDGESYPASYILLQRKGVVYKDTLEGIEGITHPRPSEATTAPYEIQHIEPGTYRISFMNQWLPATVVDNVTFADSEHKVLNVVWDTVTYKVSGGCALDSGELPTTSHISGVVCLNIVDRSVIFGRLTREVDGTISAYEVPGLSGSDTYQLIFYRETGADDMPVVYPVGSPFQPGEADVALDAVITLHPEPILTIRAEPDSDDPGILRITVFSTAYLVDESVEILTGAPGADLTTGAVYLASGSGSLGNLVFRDDRRSMEMVYTGNGGGETIQLVVSVHYGTDADPWSETFAIDTGSALLKSEVVNPYTAAQVSLGGGDDSRIYFPAGALESSDGSRAILRIEKYVESAATGFSGGAALTGGPALSQITTQLPAGVTEAGPRYEMELSESGSGLAATLKGRLTVQIAYDPERVSRTDLLDIYQHTGDAWTAQTTGRTLDAENSTLAAEVSSLSTFVVGEGTPPEPEPEPQTAAGPADTDSSDCFIGAGGDGPFQPFWLILGILALALMLNSRSKPRAADADRG